MQVPFFNPELSRETVSSASESATTGLVQLLGSPLLRQEIEQGNVTLAMIRPALVTSTVLEGTDSDQANEIERHIENLGELAKFAVTFDPSAIDEFYGEGPKQIQEAQPPLRFPSFSNRWDEFSRIMTSGPTTVLLLHKPDGSAIAEWRKQVGHWNIEANRDPATIRGRFGIDNYNNLVHGSDSPESVSREIDIIVRRITER